MTRTLVLQQLHPADRPGAPFQLRVLRLPLRRATLPSLMARPPRHAVLPLNDNLACPPRRKQLQKLRSPKSLLKQQPKPTPVGATAAKPDLLDPNFLFIGGAYGSLRYLLVVQVFFSFR